MGQQWVVVLMSAWPCEDSPSSGRCVFEVRGPFPDREEAWEEASRYPGFDPHLMPVLPPASKEEV